jgi:hypothetical protein
MRRGVLAGLDKDGRPMPPVTYRPKSGAKAWTRAQQRKRIAGVTAATGDNLTSAQYRRLTGPPLAPRGMGSRVITKLHTGYGWDSTAQTGFAEGAWRKVVSKTGYEFLEDLFEGRGPRGRRIPARDLRGVRPQGRREALRQLREWGVELVRRLFP